MTPTTWEIVARWCWLRADRLRQEWSAEIPPRGAVPSASIERATDRWCAKLSRDPDVSFETTDELKPWILARLLCAGAIGQTLQDLPDILPPENMRVGLETLLITEWCAQGRYQWEHLPPR